VARTLPQAIPPRDYIVSLSRSAIWLRDLSGGLPPDFDYGVIRSVADAKALILVLPNCDRGQAAVGLHRNRLSIGVGATYLGIMAAWDHDHRETVDAFGSIEQFIGALRDVAPPLDLQAPKHMEIWRGAVVDRDDALRCAIGLSWTRSRSVACWFALHGYVPALQPSLVPVVLHANLDQSAIVAKHKARAEQEVIVDVNRLCLANGTVSLDGANISLGGIRFADFDPDGTAVAQLIARWRLASARYERWKNWIMLRRRLAAAHVNDTTVANRH
jgi:hypothetical protein